MHWYINWNVCFLCVKYVVELLVIGLQVGRSSENALVTLYIIAKQKQRERERKSFFCHGLTHIK